MIRIAVCDDEPNIRACLCSLIKKQETECEITEYGSADEYLAAGREYDLLFLDIKMQDQTAGGDDAGKNGMQLAGEIRSRDSGKQPVIIFVTGYQEYVFDAFDVGAFQYLLKPVDTKKFAEVFKRAAEQICARQELQKKSLVIQYCGTKKAIPINDIYYVESRSHKAVIHAGEGEFEYYARMEDLEAELPGQFFRIHRGYLINLSYVDVYSRKEVTLMNGDRLTVSKYKYNDFVRAYLDYVAGDSL